jgi:uncharacterized protein (UPF0276 family)
MNTERSVNVEDNRVTIFIEDDMVSVQMRKHIPFPDFVQIWTNGLHNVMNSVLNAAPLSQHQAIKEDIYNLVNVAASALLFQFAPELEPDNNFDPKTQLLKENEAIIAEFEAAQKAEQRRINNGPFSDGG